ncbi:hypothetical protein SEA_SPEEDDEMON_1530 [Gordonia phage SpeedDemon]|uniref:Uncharacterized protein n=1 Tax=Gordonia phage Bantam TaxID=1887641 RepID=A0A1B3AYN7_9CAUD|nr:hypothetical protein BIZ77_gp024 [Gordonia phage Bantam]AOE43844.1 hypothetical protein SEA_BANTAM_155 [Gordonia phage Bantam]QNL30603.1 hypothetical protein SEA_SPEEDDEMON_1530 [Gordonia phage SpeedDemon]
MATLNDFVEAYEAYDGDNVGTLIHMWERFYLPGIETPCPDLRTGGLHQITDGSCDLCGAKNF